VILRKVFVRTNQKNPLPTNCCKTSSDCNTGNQCIFGDCDYERNQCQRNNICSGPPPVQTSCVTDRDCYDDNICTTEKCIDTKCVTSANPDIRDRTCCQKASDCPIATCSTAKCTTDTFTCFYVSTTPCNEYNADQDKLTQLYQSAAVNVNNNTSTNDNKAGVGDVIGAVIGFVILGILIVAFLVVVILMIAQKIIRKVTAERS